MAEEWGWTDRACSNRFSAADCAFRAGQSGQNEIEARSTPKVFHFYFQKNGGDIKAQIKIFAAGCSARKGVFCAAKSSKRSRPTQIRAAWVFLFRTGSMMVCQFTEH